MMMMMTEQQQCPARQQSFYRLALGVSSKKTMIKQEKCPTPTQVVRVDQFVCVLAGQLTVTHICAPAWIC